VGQTIVFGGLPRPAAVMRCSGPQQRTNTPERESVPACYFGRLLQRGDNRVPWDAFMPGNRSENRNESAEAKWIVVWNHNPLMKRLRGLQDDMTTDLVHGRVLPSPA
jgi:hypothetical protein